MKTNPAAGLRLRMYYPQPEKMDLFTSEETQLIVAAPLRALSRARRADFPTNRSWCEAVYRLKMHHLILTLLFSTGMRPCELRGLELNDFQRESLKLRIRNKGNHQYIVRDRHVFITMRTRERIEELLQLSIAVRCADSREKVFIHYHGGGPLSANYPNTVIKRWAGECGIARNVYAYMARYTFCTRLVENGVDLYSLRKLMGHKQIAVTLKHYLKLSPREIRREWKQFNPFSEGVS
jgi:site-specific recombinase XerD